MARQQIVIPIETGYDTYLIFEFSKYKFSQICLTLHHPSKFHCIPIAIKEWRMPRHDYPFDSYDHLNKEIQNLRKGINQDEKLNFFQKRLPKPLEKAMLKWIDEFSVWSIPCKTMYEIIGLDVRDGI